MKKKIINKKELEVAEFFNSLAGEIDIGQPSIFIRFSKCNLIEEKKGCEFCDTKWSQQQGIIMSVQDILNTIKSFKANHKNIVLTGGEPFYQDEYALCALISKLLDLKYHVSIETNGTIYKSVVICLDNINCSPKKQALDYTVLRLLSKLPQIRFKFVYESNKDKWWEQVISKLKIDNSKVWIMPEGKTQKEQLLKMKEAAEYCIKKGFNLSPRLHILCWGKKRGV